MTTAREGSAGTLREPAGRSSTTHAATPAWSAVAAWGAGLLEIALGAGAVTGSEGGLAVRGIGVLLVALGAAALGWGAATLARGRVVVPRAGVVGTVVGIAVSAAALLVDPGRVSVIAVAAASVLLLAVAAACGRTMRTDARSEAAEPTAPRVSVLLVAAFVVAGIVTPALGATEAGLMAPDHSDHAVLVDPGHH